MAVWSCAVGALVGDTLVSLEKIGTPNVVIGVSGFTGLAVLGLAGGISVTGSAVFQATANDQFSLYNRSSATISINLVSNIISGTTYKFATTLTIVKLS